MGSSATPHRADRARRPGHPACGVIANNLANVNTTALQARPCQLRDARLSGRDRARRRLDGRDEVCDRAQSSAPASRVQGTAPPRSSTQGSLSTTGGALDMALEGDGFFQVQMPGGTLGYTRAGNFKRSAEGPIDHRRRLSGGAADPPIPEGTTSRSPIGTDGTVSAQRSPARPKAASSASIQTATLPQFGRARRRTGDNSLVETSAQRRRRSGAAGLDRPRRASARARSKPRTSMSSRNWST